MTSIQLLKYSQLTLSEEEIKCSSSSKFPLHTHWYSFILFFIGLLHLIEAILRWLIFPWFLIQLIFSSTLYDFSSLTLVRFFCFCFFPISFFRKFIQHKIHHVKVYSSVAFSTSTVVCWRHLYLALKHFIILEGDFISIKQLLSIPPSLEPPASTSLLSVPVDWPVLYISYEWRPTRCALSGPGSLT